MSDFNDKERNLENDPAEIIRQSQQNHMEPIVPQIIKQDYDSSWNQKPVMQNYFAHKKEKRQQNSSFSVLTLVICVALSLVIGATSGFVTSRLYYKNTEIPPATEIIGSPSDVTIEVDETVNSTIEAVAKKVSPSVVGIRTTAAVQNFFGGSSESTGEGSGIIYSSDGYIITNYHVIESAVKSAKSSIEVFFDSLDDNAITATVVGYNVSYDLAVIKISASGLVKMQLADQNTLAVGQYVAAVGAPGGLEYMDSVSYGIISGLDRKVAISGYESTTVSLIQTDAAINPGNSGGALVNVKGELIGINSSKIVSESFEGMGFAIPVNTVKEICDKIILKESDPDPYIGITLSRSWDKELLEKYGYPVGAVVNSVVEGGPAYKAGIRGGDIITQFDGEDIEGFEELNELVLKTKPGDRVTVKFYRSGGYYSTSVKIGSNNAQ